MESNVYKNDSDMSQEDHNRLLDKLIEVSLDNRKFEIGLLWTRSNNFWLFIAALLVGLGYVYKTTSSTGIPFLYSITGFIFSSIWTLANRGSKFWQESWEEKTQFYFEKRYNYSSLLSRVRESQEGVFPTVRSKNFSLSRLMIVASDFFVIFWGSLALYFAAHAFVNDISFFGGPVFRIIAYSYVSVVGIAYSFYAYFVTKGKHTAISRQRLSRNL